MDERCPRSDLQREKILIVLFGHVKVRRTAVALVIVLLLIVAAIYFRPSLNPAVEPSRGPRPFDLSESDRRALGSAAARGDCAAAYRLAQFPLYASLNMQEAERNFRRASKCQNADAPEGLILTLRKPENDSEVDSLLIALRKISPERGHLAAEDVALQRAERGRQ